MPIEIFYLVHNRTWTNVTSASEDTKMKTFFFAQKFTQIQQLHLAT